MDLTEEQHVRPGWLAPSVVVLVLSNLVPLIGVVFWGWELFPVMVLFWAENVIIGAYNALRMLTAAPDLGAAWVGKLFVVPFFCVHYGGFCFVHGVFVFGLFGGGFKGSGGFPTPATFARIIGEQHLWLAVAALAASHGFSFVWNYLRGGEYKRVSFQELMGRPYGRIMVLHVAIIGGGFLMMALHTPTAGLALLVVLKIALDVRGHLRERRRMQQLAELPEAPSYTSE